MNAPGSGSSPGGGGAGIAHIFLKLDGIKGDARAQKHDGETEVSSWSWGETQSVFPSETRKAGGSVTMRELEFSAVTSAASAQFFLHCAAAKRIKTAVLTCEQDTGSAKHT